MVTENRENVNNAAAVDGGVNNAAAIDALKGVYRILETLQPFTLHLNNVSLMREFRNRLCRAKKVVDVALSAPPRNCDRFATVKDAAIAFARERQDAPHPCPDFTFSVWLFAPATK